MVGMLSTTFAEVWLGFVFITPGTPFLLFLMVIFYGLHVVFYFNLAIHFNRVSITSLYWWGVLFGLYEAWVTTMVYYGYANIIAHHGEILGIAIYEYFANVFFWHPINSFILTLTALKILFSQNNQSKTTKEETLINKMANNLAYNTRKNKLFWILYTIYTGGMITSCTYGSEQNLVLYYTTFYMLTLLVYYLLSKRTEKLETTPLHLVRMSGKGLTILGAILAIVYIWNFIYEVGGKPIYNPFAFVIILLTYIWAVYMLKRSKNKENNDIAFFEKEVHGEKSCGVISTKFLLLVLVLPLVVSLALRASILLAWIWSIIAVEITMIFGIIFLIVFSLATIKQ